MAPRRPVYCRTHSHGGCVGAFSEEFKMGLYVRSEDASYLALVHSSETHKISMFVVRTVFFLTLNAYNQILPSLSTQICCSS